jgi:hypothetical protein
MIDPTKLTMGLTVEELEKLEALERTICSVRLCLRSRTSSTTRQSKTWSFKAPKVSPSSVWGKEENRGEKLGLLYLPGHFPLGDERTSAGRPTSSSRSSTAASIRWRTPIPC